MVTTEFPMLSNNVIEKDETIEESDEEKQAEKVDMIESDAE
jgi:hypothetical protein